MRYIKKGQIESNEASSVPIFGFSQPLMGALMNNNFSREDSFRALTERFSPPERNLS